MHRDPGPERLREVDARALLSTLLLHDGGTAHVFGHDVFEQPREVKRLINRVSVEASFFKRLSPSGEPEYGARLYGVDAAVARPRDG